MGLVGAVAIAGALVVVGVAVRWFDPTVLGRVARESGLGARAGWAAYLLAVALVVAPLVAGASVGTERGIEAGETWMFGSALAALGVYLLAIAVSSVDEYRALAGARTLGPAEMTAGSGEAVAASGTPRTEGETVAPLSGAPTVHADWLVQERARTGLRRTWQNRAGGVQTRPFGLGGDRLRVVPGDHRAFGGETVVGTVGPDEELPEAAAETFRNEAALPAPAERTDRVRLVEEVVPADAPVTVVGVPERETDGIVIRRGPADPLLDSDRLRTGSGVGGEAEPVLVAGDVDSARSQLRRRVRWLGAAGLALVVGGEALAFALSPATLPV